MKRAKRFIHTYIHTDQPSHRISISCIKKRGKGPSGVDGCVKIDAGMNIKHGQLFLLSIKVFFITARRPPIRLPLLSPTLFIKQKSIIA